MFSSFSSDHRYASSSALGTFSRALFKGGGSFSRIAWFVSAKVGPM